MPTLNFEKTYCNPTPLPDYPIGRNCYNDDNDQLCDFRETADPTVIYEDGVWYLYPSCGMVYWSEDFIHWQHERMEPYDIGYAPTVVKHRGKFLMTACRAGLYEAESPRGPFYPIGDFKTPAGNSLSIFDPMLFSDDDGRLYLYHGGGGRIYAAELDADNPTRLLCEPQPAIEKNTVDHPWERLGEWNENGAHSWTEGSWMYKRNGVYYLTYSAPGTEWATYAMGAYKSSTPLGPWEYMKTSPFLRTTHGLVRGTGHGCLVDGPNGTVWAFYTCCICYANRWERRIGYDPIAFDENGDIIPTHASEIPQWVPGLLADPCGKNDAGLLPLTPDMCIRASSCAPGRDALYAADKSTLSFWQPAESDPHPTLTYRLLPPAQELRAARLVWRDVGLDIRRGYLPGPFGYRIEAEIEPGQWITLLDRSDNEIDMAIDYLPLPPTRATAVRLVITKKPAHIEPGLIDFTVFGLPIF